MKIAAPKIRLEVIDGLRGFAIITVVLYHIWQISWFSHSFVAFGQIVSFEFLATTGMLGVPLFFFISGFGLYYSYSLQPSVKTFIRKRLLRILPGYLLSIVVLSLFFNAPFKDFNEWLWQISSHLLFIFNWFNETYGTINGVYWTLAVEVQFYVLFPFIYKVFRKWPLLVTGFLLIAAQAYRIFALNQIDRFDFFLNQLPGFIDFFALGMLASYLYITPNAFSKWIKTHLGIATILGVGGFIAHIAMLLWAHSIRYEIGGISAWQANYRLLLGLIFFITATGSLWAFSAWKKILGNKFLLFFSAISYALFLWHQIIARTLLENKIPNYLGTDYHADKTWQLQFTILVFIVSCLVAYVLTYCFEQPIAKAKLFNRTKKD